MSRLHPVKHKVFRKYLLSLNCKFDRINGGHEIWSKNGILRPITFPIHGDSKKDISSFYIESNLKTLGLTKDHFLKWIKANI